MWLIELLPTWIFPLAIFTGLIGYVASFVLNFIPSIGLHTTIIRVVSTLVIIFGVWFSAYYSGEKSNEEKWQEKIKVAEEKVAVSEQAAKEANDKLRIKQDEYDQLRQEKNKSITKYLDKWHTKEILVEVQGPERVKIEKIIEYIEKCPVPKELLDAHNAAAKNQGMSK